MISGNWALLGQNGPKPGKSFERLTIAPSSLLDSPTAQSRGKVLRLQNPQREAQCHTVLARVKHSCHVAATSGCDMTVGRRPWIHMLET